MAKQNVKQTILLYASVAFILLGVLFGMNIMSFIFGSLGPDVAGLDRTSITIINETESTLSNTVNYTVAQEAIRPAYNLLSILYVANTSGTIIPVQNFTFDSGSGVISVNSSRTTADGYLKEVNFSYTGEYDGVIRETAVDIQNDSLLAIQTYSEGSDTQFSTISIAIILVILISLFLLFWTFFMGGKSKERNTGSFT